MALVVPSDRDRRVLRVMTFNVRGLRDDRAAVVEVLREAAPDVVAVQEPPRGPAGRRRLERLARAADLEVAVAGGGARTTALLTAPGLVVLDPHGAALPWTPPRTRRGLAVAEVDGIRVVGVHLGLTAAERARHADRIRQLVTTAPGPVVVAGDLNEPPGGPTWRTLGRHLRDLSAESGPTYPARDPRTRIDVVLGSPACEPGGAERRTGQVAERASDHLAVVADVLVT